MNKINYEREMEKIISSACAKEVKPKLLLHACCAPCASAVVERLIDFFDITLYFYNPNMDSNEEYDLRACELKRLAEFYGVKYIIEQYNANEFFNCITGLENQKEGGARCEKCFYLRLTKTAQKAKDIGQEFFATTLTISPLKNAELLNSIGLDLHSKTGVNYLVSDFKKKNGYIRSIELSSKLSLYRQSYCGCVFSKRERGL